MVLIVWTFLIVISSCITIRAKTNHSTIQLLIFKLLTIGLIISFAVIFRYNHDFYFFTIISGLFFSLIGDIFLIFPKKHFLRGLISFLIGHIFYIVAFSSERTVILASWIPLPLILYGLAIFYILRSHLGKMLLPVLIYMIIILVMAWQAWERWLWFQNRMALCAAVGAVLFLISDSLLAINRFKRSFKMAEVLILSTYFSAQWLIALSLQSN